TVQSHDLVVAGGTLEAIRAAADVGAQCSSLAVVFAGTSASGMPGQQQAVPLHQPVDALGVDRGQTIGSPLALEGRGDPAVLVGRPCVDKTADRGRQFTIAITGLRPTLPAHAPDTLHDSP